MYQELKLKNKTTESLQETALSLGWLHGSYTRSAQKRSLDASRRGTQRAALPVHICASVKEAWTQWKGRCDWYLPLGQKGFAP